MQAVSGGVGGDGALKAWSAGTPDWAAAGFPGPGTAQHTAIRKVIRDDVLVTTGNGSELGRRIEWTGSIWAQRRGWITPDIDLTGVADATAGINAALTAASTRPGSCVYLPEGIIRVGTSGVAGPASIFTVPPAVTLVGPERGFRLGHRHFSPLAQAGALLKVYGTGKLFTQKYDSTVGNIEIYYPDQVTTIGGAITAPAVYDWTFYVAADEHGTTTFNITPINPYRFYYCSAGGAKISDVLGYPLSVGIHLARCPAVVKANNISFYPANDSSQDPSLLVWTHANARAWLIDGAEGYDISSISMGPYNVGIQFVDEDGDAFKGCYGRIEGADIEATNICVHVPQPTGLVEIGGKFSDCIFVPELAVGNALLVADNFTPADHRQNPGLWFSQCSIHSGTSGSDRAVWLQSTSHAIVSWVNSPWHSFLNEGLRNDSATASAYMSRIAIPTGSTRTAGTGAISDVDQITT
jgi:hypothetical protein